MTEHSEAIPAGWKATKEIATDLMVLPASLRVYRSRHPNAFEGEVRRFLRKHEGKLREELFWSPEAQRILTLGIKNKPFEEWKEEVTAETIEKGFVITSNTKPMELVKLVAQQIIHVVNAYEQIEQRVERLEFKDRYMYVTPKTKKLCRDEVKRVVVQYYLKWQDIWISKRDKYNFNSYDDMTEDIAQKIIRELNEEYPPKGPQRKIF